VIKASLSRNYSPLKAADLEFISMVNWQWDLMDLFKEKDPENARLSGNEFTRNDSGRAAAFI